MVIIQSRDPSVHHGTTTSDGQCACFNALPHYMGPLVVGVLQHVVAREGVGEMGHKALHRRSPIGWCPP